MSKQEPSPSESLPWYQQGLKFKCTGCGDCCTGAPGYVWLNGADIKLLAAETDLTVAEFERRYVRAVGVRKSLKELKGGDCVFFDNKSRRCQVYKARPRQCRTWPFWDSNLRSPETWEQTREACPGCGKGKLYDLEFIETQRNIIHV
jgi:uncharacterized protein